jgi:hypothetical protein
LAAVDVDNVTGHRLFGESVRDLHETWKKIMLTLLSALAKKMYDGPRRRRRRMFSYGDQWPHTTHQLTHLSRLCDSAVERDVPNTPSVHLLSSSTGRLKRCVYGTS